MNLLHCNVEDFLFDVFQIFAVAAADVQKQVAFHQLLFKVAFDLFDDFVVEVEAETIIGLLHELSFDLSAGVSGQNLGGLGGQILGQQGVDFLHGVLVVPLGVAVEVVGTKARRELDLPEGQGKPSGPVDHLPVHLVQLSPAYPVQPCVASSIALPVPSPEKTATDLYFRYADVSSPLYLRKSITMPDSRLTETKIYSKGECVSKWEGMPFPAK